MILRRDIPDVMKTGIVEFSTEQSLLRMQPRFSSLSLHAPNSKHHMILSQIWSHGTFTLLFTWVWSPPYDGTWSPSLMLDMLIYVNNPSCQEANLSWTCCSSVTQTILNQLIIDGFKLWRPCLFRLLSNLCLRSMLSLVLQFLSSVPTTWSSLLPTQLHLNSLYGKLCIPRPSFRALVVSIPQEISMLADHVLLQTMN